MSVMDLSRENFEDVVTRHDFVIIDFWAPWCAPCRSFAPVFEEAAEKHPDILFAKVNTEEQPELAASFQIRSIPTLMMLREKVIIFSQPGALPAASLDDLIHRAKALDMEQVHREIAEQQGK